MDLSGSRQKRIKKEQLQVKKKEKNQNEFIKEEPCE